MSSSRRILGQHGNEGFMAVSLRHLILDAMADDWEDIEQIHKSISFQYISNHLEEGARKISLFRQAEYPPLLADIIDSLRSMVEEGAVECDGLEGGGSSDWWGSTLKLLRCHFRPTEKGLREIKSVSESDWHVASDAMPHDIRDLR